VARPVRVGNLVEVSGTAAADEQGNILGGDDYYEQTKAALRIIGEGLGQPGASLEPLPEAGFRGRLAPWGRLPIAVAGPDMDRI
jgi:hypothetical protein